MRTGADKVSPSHIQKYKLSTNKGTGIFILSKAEVESLNLNKKEMEKIKPFFKNSDIKKYFTNEQAKEFLIDVFYPFDKDISEAEYPNLLKHLKGFKEILSGRKENANGLDKAIAKGQYWFGAVRRKLDFESKKILCPQRSKENIFAMNDVSWYSSADVYYITPIKPTLNMEEVLGILNSNLMFIWLYHRGKRKGESLELYQVPLSEMPIKVSNSNVISDLVKQIVTKAKNNLDYSSQQEQLNIEVYKLYDIQYEEVKILDPDFKISEKLYNSPRNNMGK
jgi:adenine-specific DNA-methyltransferase